MRSVACVVGALAAMLAVVAATPMPSRRRTVLPGMEQQQAGFGAERARAALETAVQLSNKAGISEKCLNGIEANCGVNVNDPTSVPCIDCLSMLDPSFTADQIAACFKKCCPLSEQFWNECLPAQTGVCSEDELTLINLLFSGIDYIVEGYCTIDPCADKVIEECTKVLDPDETCKDCPDLSGEAQEECYRKCCPYLLNGYDCVYTQLGETDECSPANKEALLTLLGLQTAPQTEYCLSQEIPRDCTDAIDKDCPSREQQQSACSKCASDDQACYNDCCTAASNAYFCTFKESDTEPNCMPYTKQVQIQYLFDPWGFTDSFCQSEAIEWERLQAESCGRNLENTCNFSFEDLPCMDCSQGDQSCYDQCCPEFGKTFECVLQAGNWCPIEGAAFLLAGLQGFLDETLKACGLPGPTPTGTMSPETESAEPSETAGPTDKVVPSESAEPSETAGEASESAAPSETAGPTDKVVPSESAEPSETAGPTDKVVPSESASATDTGGPSETPTATQNSGGGSSSIQCDHLVDPIELAFHTPNMAPVVCLQVDSRAELCLTPDHAVLLDDGSTVEAGQTRVGDMLASGRVSAIRSEPSALVCAPYHDDGVVMTTIGAVPVYPKRHESKFWAFAALAKLVGRERMVEVVNTRLLKQLW